MFTGCVCLFIGKDFMFQRSPVWPAVDVFAQNMSVMLLFLGFQTKSPLFEDNGLFMLQVHGHWMHQVHCFSNFGHF